MSYVPARHGRSGRDKTRRGSYGEVNHGKARSVAERLVRARCGSHGELSHGWLWCGWQHLARFSRAVKARSDTLSRGTVWCCELWQGSLGAVSYGVVRPVGEWLGS